jgi:ABC-2 type transport system ATP-binding protein
VELADDRISTALAPPELSIVQRSAPTATVSVRGLTKRFAPRSSVGQMLRLARRPPPVAVVDHVTLDVARGEVFGLLGPNGAGKTTLFKMLSTMIAPDEGGATVAGYDVVRERASIRGVLASVPADERSLNWRLSAEENLRLFAALQRVARSETISRIAAVLDTVGLSDTRDKRVGEFSSGMRQRLLIARALLTRPKILLLDEPTRALDPVSARELRRFLREELVGRQRCTILLATHNTDEAFGFCDRVAVLDHGRVLAIGPAAELTARFGEERYRVLTRDPRHVGFTALEQLGLLRRGSLVESTSAGWTSVECTIAGDPSRSADVLRMLVERGVEVARLERVETSLADLMTRIIGVDSEARAHA